MKRATVIAAQDTEAFELKLNAELKRVADYNPEVQTHVNYIVITEGDDLFKKDVYHARFHAVIIYEIPEGGEQNETNRNLP